MCHNFLVVSVFNVVAIEAVDIVNAVVVNLNLILEFVFKKFEQFTSVKEMR